MGTNVSLAFICTEAALADSIAAQVFAIIHTYELRFSRFLLESELSRLNQKGSLVVNDDFIKVLRKSIELHKFTQGAFNPLLQVKKLGYDTTFTTLNKPAIDVSMATYNTDITKIKIDETTNTVELDYDQQLDFGGILKGYLATKLADEITQKYSSCTGLIINIGGDLATRGYDEFHKPFIFELYNPVTGEEIPITLTNTSLATSGTYARRWQTNNGPRHHIVDARTQQNPTQKMTTASVVHSDGAVAEALTKLFLVQGVTQTVTSVPPEIHNYKYFTVSSNGDINTNII